MCTVERTQTMINNTIHVAMASDDRYAHHLSVAICSILKNMSKDRNLCIYLLHETLSEETKTKLEQLQNLRQFDLEFINVTCEKYAPFKVIGLLYVSRLTYARFQLPFILESLDKCIYLDCDILVRQDLSELWDIQLPEHAFFGAIEEPYARTRNKDLGIPDRYSYFNAGVLLLDLVKLRDACLEEKAFEYLKEKGSLLYADQDVLNALFYKTWHALPLKWNVYSAVLNLRKTNIFYRYSVQEIDNVYEDVAIAHFTQERKPDSFISESPYRNEYWEYMKYTAWKYSWPKDISPITLAIRFYWLIKLLLSKLPILFISMRMVKRIIAGYYFNKEQSNH